MVKKERWSKRWFYTRNNKTIAHHYIRDGCAVALQRTITLARYILPTAKLDTKEPHLLWCDPGAKSLDISFEIDPVPSPDAPAVCGYACVGGISASPPENVGRRRCAFTGHREEEIDAAKENG